jgi:hypothetical protein
VFAAYVSGKGHAFIDRALYLPKTWAEDPARRAAAHVPQQIAFATKPHLARAMVERAIAAGVPFAWVVGDSIYRVSAVEMARAGPARAMCSASAPPASSTPGGPSLRLPGLRPRLPAHSIPPPGTGCRPGPEPRASGCSIGPIWNWPILKLTFPRESGHGVTLYRYYVANATNTW